MTHKPQREGFKKTAKPRWIGPGHVLFQEVLADQEEGDERRLAAQSCRGGRLDYGFSTDETAEMETAMNGGGGRGEQQPSSLLVDDDAEMEIRVFGKATTAEYNLKGIDG